MNIITVCQELDSVCHHHLSFHSSDYFMSCSFSLVANRPRESVGFSYRVAYMPLPVHSKYGTTQGGYFGPLPVYLQQETKYNLWMSMSAISNIYEKYWIF